MKTGLKNTLFWTLSILLAIALLYYFAYKANWNLVLKELKSANLYYVFLAVSGEILFLLARVVRWKIILKPLQKPLSNSNLLKATVVSFAVSGVTPAKLGEVVRPALLSRMEGVPFTTSVASIILERGLDLIAIVTLWFIFIFFGGKDVSKEASSYIVVLNKLSLLIFILFILILPLLFLYVRRKSVFEEYAKKNKFINRFSLIKKIFEHFFIFTEGLMSFRKKRTIFLLYIVSLIVWGFNALTCFFAPKAVHLSLPWGSGPLILTLSAIGASIPTPGGVGGVHKAIYIALAIFYSIDEEKAVSAALLGHAMMFLPSIVWGCLYFLTGKVKLKEVKYLRESP